MEAISELEIDSELQSNNRSSAHEKRDFGSNSISEFPHPLFRGQFGKTNKSDFEY